MNMYMRTQFRFLAYLLFASVFPTTNRHGDRADELFIEIIGPFRFCDDFDAQFSPNHLLSLTHTQTLTVALLCPERIEPSP